VYCIAICGNVTVGLQLSRCVKLRWCAREGVCIPLCITTFVGLIHACGKLGDMRGNSYVSRDVGWGLGEGLTVRRLKKD
jgi:hypothetical protein